MDYTRYYCHECKCHGCDSIGVGICFHPEVDMKIDGNSRACFRLSLKKTLHNNE